MANFVPGDASPISEIKPWSPDWSFLSQVYGVTQARYDKGFNQVKSLYNSVLNSALTNSDNQQFRQQMFEKLQGSLRNVSALDLSNPTNVMRAQQLLNPITEDQELAYDMYVTKFHENQKAMMNSYMNSTDAKVRAQYSDYSKLDIKFAEDDLRNAKRGDGSITAVQPRSFTPFEDINEYLNAASKDAKLQVKFASPDGKGYIMTYTNGKYAEVPFSNWAAMTMGNRFDRQFDVIARVTAESQIRDLMGQGMSRQQATNQVAKTLSTDYLKSENDELADTDLNLTGVEQQLQTIRDLYPEGIPTGKQDVMERYKKLLELQTQLSDTKSQSESEIKKVEQDPENYTVSNLYSILAKQAKRNSATLWGVNTADATAEIDVKPDQKVISDWDRAAANARAAADRELRYKIHKEEQQMEMLKMEKQEELAVMKLKAEGKLPSETYVGSYVGTGLPGVDVLSQANAKNKGELFNNAFGAQTGLMNMVIGKNKDHSKYYTVLSKVNSMAQGSGQKLTASEKGVLKEYARLVGYNKEIGDLKSASAADALVSQLAGNTYTTATRVLQWYSDNGKATEGRKYAQSFQGTINSMKGIMQEQRELDKSYREIASAVFDFRTGKIKPGYEGAKIISRMQDGTPIFDLSKLPESKRQHLGKVVGSEFEMRARPVGSIYTMTKPSPDEMFTFFNKNNTIKVTANGEKLDPSIIGNMDFTSQTKLFGESFQASFDPSGKKIIVDLKVAADSPIAGKMKVKAGETVRVEMPYELVQSSPALSRFKRYINQNSVVADSYGIMEEFSRNKNARVEAPTHMTATGFDWTAAGVKNAQGQYGVNLNFSMVNPQKGVKESTSRFLQIDPNDPSQFLQLSEMINDTWTNYQNAYGSWEQQYDMQDLISYPEIEY